MQRTRTLLQQRLARARLSRGAIKPVTPTVASRHYCLVSADLRIGSKLRRTQCEQMSSELPLKAASLNTVGMFQRCKRTSPALFDYLVGVGENRRRSLSSGRIGVTRWLAMTAVAHSAPVYEFESSRQDNDRRRSCRSRRRSCRSRAPSFGRHPPQRRFCMQSWPQAARLLLFAVPCYDSTISAACPRSSR